MLFLDAWQPSRGLLNTSFVLSILALSGLGIAPPACAQTLPVTMRATAPPRVPSQSQLDSGFREMYSLNFDRARGDFTAYETAHPDDPVGQAAQAASYLYEEFHRKGVFTSSFFLDDKKFLHGIPDRPDKPLCDKFLELDGRAQTSARQVLKSNPHDANALLALTLADGMMADFDEIIAKKQFASLHDMRDAEADAARLLSVAPGDEDAYVAIGAANYVLGSLPAYKRAFLWLGDIHGDRVRGMNQLKEAALHGHYLKPLAEILLALASLREHHPAEARNLLLQLSHDFPQNPVFSNELATAEKMAAVN
ncbi:MAG TPA: hypothetical protein VGT03_11300 [Candidatus Acidoferrales bacterium]|nr:hypothetical protein [Candidatus Acidoferrales bacterium]